METNLHDDTQSWSLQADGSWRRLTPGAKPKSAHIYFMTNPSLSGVAARCTDTARTTIHCGSLTEMLALAASAPHERFCDWPRLRPWFDRAALVTGLALAALFWPTSSVSAQAPITLKVEAFHGLPGLHHSALSRFLAIHMADAGLVDWRFEPAEGDHAAPNRVEWTFKLNPYAGGGVRRFVPQPAAEEGFGVPRPVMVEVRLYLHGEFQMLVERQAVIKAGPSDPELAATVASATEKLLGPSGAYRAMDLGQHPAPRSQ